MYNSLRIIGINFKYYSTITIISLNLFFVFKLFVF